jgi:hypothetical protein
MYVLLLVLCSLLKIRVREWLHAWLPSLGFSLSLRDSRPCMYVLEKRNPNQSQRAPNLKRGEDMYFYGGGFLQVKVPMYVPIL